MEPRGEASAPGEEGRSAQPPLPSAPEREAARFLGREIVPLLGREADPGLRQAVSEAAATGSLRPLGGLGEPGRRALLDTVDRWLARRRPAHVSPAALVRLTTELSALPASDLASLRRLSPPAR